MTGVRSAHAVCSFVLGVVAEAALQAAEESVAQSPQGLVGARPPAEDAALGVGAQSVRSRIYADGTDGVVTVGWRAHTQRPRRMSHAVGGGP